MCTGQAYVLYFFSLIIQFDWKMRRGYKRRYPSFRRSRSRSRKRTRYASRSRSRSRSYRSRRSYVPRNPLALERITVGLRYNQVISLNPKPEALGSTGSNVWQFRSNSLYDTDVTGVGHQPLYFDNYAAVFERYYVKYATITVTVINHSVNTAYFNSLTSLPVTTPNYSYKLFILNDNSQTTSEYPAQMEQIIEEAGRQVKWRFVAPSLTGKLPKLRHSCVPYRLANKPKRDTTLEADTTSNPTNVTSWYVGITSADGVTDPPDVYLNVSIKYTVEFFDRKNLQAQN